MASVTDTMICATITVLQTFSTNSENTKAEEEKLIKIASLCTHSLYFDFLHPMQPAFLSKMGDSTYKTYVTRQIALYNDMFIAIGRTDLQLKF